jgi:hypothetical protein
VARTWSLARLCKPDCLGRKQRSDADGCAHKEQSDSAIWEALPALLSRAQKMHAAGPDVMASSRRHRYGHAREEQIEPVPTAAPNQMNRPPLGRHRRCGADVTACDQDLRRNGSVLGKLTITHLASVLMTFVGSALVCVAALGAETAGGHAAASASAAAIPFPEINTVAPPFTVALAGRRVTGHQNSGKLLGILVKGVSKSESFQVDCDTCKYGVYGEVHRIGPQTVELMANVHSKLTSHTHIVVSAFGGPLTFSDAFVRIGIGRYRMYVIDPRVGTIHFVASGCVAAGNEGPFLNPDRSLIGLAPKQIYKIPTYTPAYVAAQGTVPCNATVPVGDALALSSPQPSVGAPAALSISGDVSGPRTLSLYAYTFSAGGSRVCPLLPLLGGTPIGYRAVVQGRFSFSQNITLPASPADGMYCAYVNTGTSTWLGEPDGRLTARQQLDWTGS